MHPLAVTAQPKPASSLLTQKALRHFRHPNLLLSFSLNSSSTMPCALARSRISAYHFSNVTLSLSGWPCVTLKILRPVLVRKRQRPVVVEHRFWVLIVVVQRHLLQFLLELLLFDGSRLRIVVPRRLPAIE